MDTIDSPALCARTVRTDEMRLNAIKGTFSMLVVKNVSRERILLKGYQSTISRTQGRETAIGLLSNARAKNMKAII
jgi:hypothetical protein